MRVLIISDTHDNMVVVSEILSIIDEEKVDLVIHCGDFVSPFVIKKLNDAKTKIIGVFGNNEGDKTTILRFANPEVISIEEQPRVINLDNTKSIIMHGWRSIEQTREIVYSIAKTKTYKYVFYGHTHKLDIKAINNGNIMDLTEKILENGQISIKNYETIVINPGEASGWLTKNPTYVILDTEKKQVAVKRFSFSW